MRRKKQDTAIPLHGIMHDLKMEIEGVHAEGGTVVGIKVELDAIPGSLLSWPVEKPGYAKPYEIIVHPKDATALKHVDIVWGVRVVWP